MSTAPTLDELFAQLQAMQADLRDGQLHDVEPMLLRHDRDVRAFLHADGGRAAGYDALATLLRAQLDLQQQMKDAREESRRQMQASQRADRAARAYLALAED
ncbi:hypothetical protein [Pseudoxanthomonas putridarboris]|uniref:Uncharacterized protein n=1 Tax=Pseudoxanthomonas putridarboris TaxID=752605 RepID=A0ABU9IZ68_9GAMM